MLAFAFALAFAPHAFASDHFVDSPYRETVPDPGPCDVVVTEANAATTLAQLDDPDLRVFCVDPGDYRDAGNLLLLASGSEASRRFLRFHATPGDLRTAIQRPTRAIFEHLRIRGSWWVIQGLTIQPRNPATARFLYVLGGDHNLLHGNLVDGSEQANTRSNEGIVLGGFNGDAATHNTVQANVVRNGNASRLDVDYHGILVQAAAQPGEDNDFNEVLDNEVYDWGDGISVGGYTGDCSEPGVQHATVIDGNDVYLTPDKWIDCDTGLPDPAGDCACAENAVELKADPGPDPALWTRVTNNRVWGFRPTSAVGHCGGVGGSGPAISGGSLCVGHVLVARNAVLDSTMGIQTAGSNWIIVGNLFHEIRASNGKVYNTAAITTTHVSSAVWSQFNTIVGVDAAYEAQADDADARCNAVVETQYPYGGPLGSNHVMQYNYLYDAESSHFDDPTNQSFPTAAESGNEVLCFWRRRWTGPERVCILFGATTAASPHWAAVGSCNPYLTVPFGLDPMTWITVPEPEVARLRGASAALLALLAGVVRHRRAA